MVLSEKPESLLEETILADMQKPHIAVGIQAFNEEYSIACIKIEAQKYADNVIVCDDGSTDSTAQIAQKLGADVVSHKQNSGYGSANRSLFCQALKFGWDVLVTLDSDGQHTATEIPQVIKPKIQGNAGLVIGSRFIDKKGTGEMSFYRQVGAKVITKMVNGSAKHGITDSQSGFRAYNRQALECLIVSEAGMGASAQILLEASKQNLKISEGPSTCKYQNGAVSTSTKNPIRHGLGVVSFLVRIMVGKKPLTILGIPGILSLITGTVFGF